MSNEMVKFTELKEVKEAIDKYVENATLDEFILYCLNGLRGFGKTEIRNYILLKLIEKEEKENEMYNL